MANWCGTSRSNYFKVKDEVAFKAWAESCYLTVYEDSDGAFMIHPEGEDGWPSRTSEDSYLDLFAELPAHLAENQVAVLMEVGAEKLRYVTGNAVAVSWTGEVVQVNLEDIYKLAQDEFGGDAVITQACY